MKTTLEIDGARFSTLEEFYDEVSRVLIPGASWGRNLDAFNDILRGGFGTPDGGFQLRWLHSDRSRDLLGYAETVRQLALRLQSCHPANRVDVGKHLDLARNNLGTTVFDWLVEIIRTHCPEGAESIDGIELFLE